MLACCDYIATRIARCLPLNDPQALIATVGKIKSDLLNDGTEASSRKTLDITDTNGKKYQVTVREL